MGESELVLDGMTIDEAMRLLSGARPAPSGARGVAAEDVGVTTSSESATRLDEPATSTREINESQLGGDWRAALRATGAGPESMARKPATPKTSDSER